MEGWGAYLNNPSQALPPAKTEETVSHRQGYNVKEVGTPPVPSNLRTPLIAVSTAMRTMSQRPVSEKATVEEQLCSKTIHPDMRAQLHLLSLDLSSALGCLFSFL